MFINPNICQKFLNKHPALGKDMSKMLAENPLQFGKVKQDRQISLNC